MTQLGFPSKSTTPTTMLQALILNAHSRFGLLYCTTPEDDDDASFPSEAGMSLGLYFSCFLGFRDI